MKHNHLALAISLALMPATVFATNGYFLPGSGFRSQGMGGVGIAYGRDALSIGANPANVTKTGMRGDLGFGVFNPERFAALGSSTGVLRPNGQPADAGFGFDGSSESDSKYFLMPEMGMTMPLTESLFAGVAFVGNGGMNTTYSNNLFSYNALNPNVPGSDAKLGVDMMQLLVPFTVGYKLNDDHSVGAALQFAVTRFRAYGLEAFALFDKTFGYSISADPDNLTGRGFDYSYGAGVKLGWQGEFLDDRLTVGLAYTSRSYMSKFDKYRGLFAEQGDFDIPENYGVGISFKPKNNLVIAADILRIKYSDVASIGNRGPGTSRLPYNAGNQLNGIISIPNSNFETGNDQGMGFGWEDQTVYKLGIQYGVNNRLLVRAGYNYGKSPIPDDQLTFNILAPAVVEKHYSVGFTYRHTEELEITGTYMYVASNSQSSPPFQNIVGSASVNMHQNLFALSLGWVLDPGPGALDEYGDGDWAGINFDGWYAGLGIGQSNYSDVDGIGSANKRAEAWKVYAGYQFNKYLALEGGYVNLNDLSGRDGSISNEIQTDAWALGAVLTYPVTEKISVMGKVGTAYLQGTRDTKNGGALTVRTEEDSYDPVYGVGLKYALFENMDLRAEWDRYDRDNMNIDLVTAGFAVKF